MFCCKIYSKKSFLRIFILVCITLLALYLRLKFFLSKGTVLLKDELWQVGLMKGSFFRLFGTLKGGDYGSYLNLDHILIFPFFKIFSYNRKMLMIPHFVATILGFYLLYLICKRYFKTTLGYIITFTIICFNNTLIEHGLGIRPYAILPTLALLSLLASQFMVEQVNPSKKIKFLIGLIFVLVILSHVFGILMFISTVLFSLLTKATSKSFSLILKNTAKLLIIVLCISLPVWFISVFGEHLRYPGQRLTFLWFSNPTVNAIGFLKSLFGTLLGRKKLYFLLIAIFFPFIFRHQDSFKQIIFLFTAVFLPLNLIFTGALINNYFFVQRQFVWVMPFFAFFIGWSCDSIFYELSSKKGF